MCSRATCRTLSERKNCSSSFSNKTRTAAQPSLVWTRKTRTKTRTSSQSTQLNCKDLENIKKTPQAGMWWSFKGRQRFVTKALRIPYTWTCVREDGTYETREDYLLIGYEGGSW